MNEGLISHRYAKALFRYAGERKMQQLIYRKMDFFLENYAKHPGLRIALDNPILSRQTKEQLLATALGMEEEDPYKEAVRLLVRNHRGGYMKSIAMMYKKIYREVYGIEQAIVTTVVELTPELKKKVRERVTRVSGRNVEIVYKINPELIGGIQIEMGSQLYDASVVDNLKKIGKEI